MSKPHLTNWTLAKSGISIQAGPARIRMEAGGTLDERKEIANFIVAAPEMFDALHLLLSEVGQTKLSPGTKAAINAIGKAEGRV